MRKTYHIKVEIEEIDKIESVFKLCNLTPISKSISDDQPDNVTVNYLINLSKYEILYLRLAVKSGFILEVEDNFQEKQSQFNSV